MAEMTTEMWLKMNEAVIDEFRANSGICGGRFEGNPMVLLTTIGARSGLQRTSPVTYTTDGDAIVLIASKAGAASHPAWYLNLVAEPKVTVEMGGDTFAAIARTAVEPERSRLYAARVAAMPRFGEYQKSTEREIPVVVIDRAGGEPR